MAINGDLFATCAQVSVAALIVLGIDAAVLQIVARARTTGETGNFAYGLLHAWLTVLLARVLIMFLPPSVGIPVAERGTTTLTGFLRDNRLFRWLSDYLARLFLLSSVALPVSGVILSIMALWLDIPELAATVAVLTISSVLLVAVLLYAQIHINASHLLDVGAASSSSGRPPVAEPVRRMPGAVLSLLTAAASPRSDAVPAEDPATGTPAAGAPVAGAPVVGAPAAGVPAVGASVAGAPGKSPVEVEAVSPEAPAVPMARSPDSATPPAAAPPADG